MNILLVNTNLNFGGTETFIMNVLHNINLRENQVDLLIYREEGAHLDYEDEVRKLGCRIFKIPPIANVNPFQHFFQVLRAVKNGHYDIVHANTFYDSGLVMLASWLCGVRVRIAHAHTAKRPMNDGVIIGIQRIIGKILINIFANKRVACSREAGQVFFGKRNFLVLTNGVDLKKYEFDQKLRRNLREKYGLTERTFVIGHIGRFDKAKNQSFAINVFEEIIRRNADSRLVLIGSGVQFNDIVDKVEECGLSNKVIFIGSTPEAFKYYSMMDVMVYPSLYEGLPFCFIEAQINGLHIVASNAIPKESNLISNITFLNLKDDVKHWADILESSGKTRHFDREFFRGSVYDLSQSMQLLMQLYGLGDAR